MVCNFNFAYGNDVLTFTGSNTINNSWSLSSITFTCSYHSAPPGITPIFFYIGKLMGAKTVYIEVFDRYDKPTLTGKLVYPITDCFIVEWEEMKKVYPKAINLGSIF